MQSRRKVEDTEFIKSSESRTDPWSNNESECALAFRSPPDRHLYYAFGNETFVDTICRCIRSVTDYYILYTQNVLSTLHECCDADELDLVRESSEDEYHAPQQLDKSWEDDDEFDIPGSPFHADQSTTNCLTFEYGDHDRILVNGWFVNGP